MERIGFYDQNSVPNDVRQMIEQAKREMSVRRSGMEQTRDYKIDCANGDQVYIHEQTRIWMEERG